MRQLLPPRLRLFHQRMADFITPDKGPFWTPRQLQNMPLDLLVFHYLHLYDMASVELDNRLVVSQLTAILNQKEHDARHTIMIHQNLQFAENTMAPSRGNTITRMLFNIDRLLDDDAYGKSLFVAHGEIPPILMDFEWMMHGYDLYLTENTTDADFKLTNWIQ